MEFIDYYHVLKVPREATEAAIKKAYRKLARQFHPDVNPDDAEAEQKFKEATEAYEVLSHAERRATYDKYSAKFGKDWEQGEAIENARRQAGAGARSHGPFDRGQPYTYQSSGGSGDFSDLFEEMFGAEGAFNEYKRSGAGRQQYARADLRASLTLPLTEIFTEHKRVLAVGGRNIRLTIPAGVSDGQTIRIKGQGKDLGKGRRGDLYLTFEVTPPQGVRRQGDDLFVDVNVDLYTALLGGKATLDAPDGPVRFTVKPGTQNGTRIRLKGKGTPTYRSDARGDLYAEVHVQLPTSLSEAERAHLQRAAQSRTQDSTSSTSCS